MAVSHYLISGIEVAGLVIGLIGAFLLTEGLYGNGIRWLRSLLPAGAFAIAYGSLGFALAKLHSPALDVFGPGFGAGLSDAQTVDVVLLLVGVGAIVGYAEACIVSFLPHRGQKSLLAPFGVWLTFGAAVGLGAATLAVLLAVIPAPPIVGLVGMLFTIACLLVAVLGGSLLLTDLQLQKLGFSLSVIAIVSQFIPPTLDLLGITISSH